MHWINNNIMILITVGVVISCALAMPTMPSGSPLTLDEVIAQLKFYGYLGQKMPMEKYRKMAETDMDSAVTMGVKFYQERYQDKLQVTGELDMKTLNLMKMKRCGNADLLVANDMMKRKKRYTLFGSDLKWPKTDLTYRISQYPQDKEMTRRQVDNEIMRAFKVWEAVSPLRFTEITTNQRVDIDIKFFQPGVNHGYPRGDGAFTDGPGGVLAHAYAPTLGDSHFDEGETFTFNTTAGVNLFQVAAHEFGHALGLGHSTDTTALMAPFYPGYIRDFMLPEDDKRGIQALYGPPRRRTTTRRPRTTTTRRTQPTTTTPARPTTSKPTISPEMNDICTNPKFDAITTLTSKGIYKKYAFQGDQYFQLDDNGIVASYPRKIKQGWPGLRNNVDAALFWDAIYNEKWVFDWKAWKWNREKVLVEPSATFVFKGSQYWRVEDMSVASGYPRDITNDWGVPGNIDAAFVWERNGKTYFFKGNQYYRYTENEGVDYGYPRTLDAWGNIPRSIDTVIQGKSGQTFFFSGSKFHVYNNNLNKVTEIKDIEPYWLKCSKNFNLLVGAATCCETSALLIWITSFLCILHIKYM